MTQKYEILTEQESKLKKEMEEVFQTDKKQIDEERDNIKREIREIESYFVTS